MLGSDYCFDMGVEQPVAAVQRIASVEVGDRARILGDTAAKLLGID